MLKSEEISQYKERGYVTPNFQLPDVDIAFIKQRHNELLERHPEFYNYCPALLAYDKAFLRIAQTPEIISMVTDVLGPDIALWNSSFFAKPANGGHATPWHQDGEYWPIEPLATCTVWIAIDAATSENGCLEVIPGSHTEQRLRKHNTNSADDITLNQEIDSHEYDSAKAEPITLKAGQLSLHDVYLVHGSNANHSAMPRRGMTLRFMPTTSVYDRKRARDISERLATIDHSERTLYLLNGIDKCGKNDFAQRK